jgi:hypothetical protein
MAESQLPIPWMAAPPRHLVPPASSPVAGPPLAEYGSRKQVRQENHRTFPAGPAHVAMRPATYRYGAYQ